MNTRNASIFMEKFGPCAVVTGASSGIGQAMAEELASIGLDLVLVARRDGLLKKLATTLQERYGASRRFDVIATDLSQNQGVEDLIEATRTHEVGLLVAAAGYGTAGDFIESDISDELDLLQVNCRAPLVLAHSFGRRFAARGRGGIILFGSLVGFQGAPGAAHYAATKSYIQTLAEGLHHELKRHNVSVLTTAPGPVKSGFAERSRMIMGATDTPQAVARGTLAALGRPMTATPGPLSKFLTASLHTAPRFLRVRIMGKIMGGMTAHLKAS